VSLVQTKAQGHDIHRDVLYTKFDRCNDFFRFNVLRIDGMGDRLVHQDLAGNKVSLLPQIPLKPITSDRPLFSQRHLVNFELMMTNREVK
jgi:hypothetical protein